MKLSLLYLYLKARKSQRKKIRKWKHHSISLEAINPISQTDWMYVWKNANNESFLSITSLSRDSFAVVLKEFKRHYQPLAGPGRRGRPPKLIFAHQMLGCLLVWYTDTMELKTLCQMFGISISTTSRVILLSEIILNKTLLNLQEAKVSWPTFDEQRTWSELVQRKKKLIERRWGFIDGKNYRVQASSDTEEQNAFYNGWVHTVFVTGAICFGVDGTIVWYRHNYPGS